MIDKSKFNVRYDVETCTIYKSADLASLRIPPPDHRFHDASAPTTFDPIRVEAIDRDGVMNSPIEVYSSPDDGILWIVDGRGRYLDVMEVNRRRKAEGREPVKALIVPFSKAGGRPTEKDVIARIREKNYARRLPTPSGIARDLTALRSSGFSWDQCCKILHVESDDPEQWCKKRLPLAFCIEAVQKAVDEGKLTLAAARRFGGSAADGSSALGKKEQAKLLAEVLEEKERAKAAPRVKSLTPKVRVMAREALNREAEKFPAHERVAAEIVAATIARIDGEESALDEYPSVAKLFAKLLEKPKKAVAAAAGESDGGESHGSEKDEDSDDLEDEDEAA